MDPLVVSEGVVVPPLAIELHAVRASGPGGQNVNKVSSKVELRVTLSAIVGLTPPQLRRLEALARGRVDDEGRLVVVSQLTRSQAQNVEDARGKVRDLVRRALVAPKRRILTKPSRAAKARRLDTKRRLSEKKQGRRFSSD